MVEGRLKQPVDAVKRQVDDLGMQGHHPREDDVRTVGGHFRAASLAGLAAGAGVTGAAGTASTGAGGAVEVALDGGGLVRQEHPDDGDEFVASSVPRVGHPVEHPVVEQVFGALEAFGQLFANGLFDHAGAREADERVGFGDLHITQHGIRLPVTPPVVG